MGSIRKPTYTRPLPEGAEVFTRKGKQFARWTDGKGRKRVAELAADGDRVLMESQVYVAKYRDGAGQVATKSTGCRDKAAAMRVLADLEAEAEKVRAGVMSADEMKTSHHAGRRFADHLKAYLEHLNHKRIRGRKVSAHYRRNVKSRLDRLTEDLELRKLRDLTAEKMNRWLAQAEAADMAPATRNEYLTSAVAFCNWCVESHRLTVNPLAKVSKADARSDARRKRRALTAEEIARLLEAARLRPVADYGRETVEPPEKDKAEGRTWAKAPVTWENVQEAHRRGREHLATSPARLARLDMRGRERALFYLVAVTTGLRRKEQASLTVGQLHLDGPNPYAELAGKDSKSGQGAAIPLRPDVAEQVRDFLAGKLAEYQRRTLADGRNAFVHELPLSMPVFENPPTIRVFDRDLLAAGIARLDEEGNIVKTDRRGRTVDLHALRHTFGTHLSKAGVSPRTAQAAMRHSRIDLTMNVYTDPHLLDVSGAVASLPDFTKAPTTDRGRQAKTGTFDAPEAPSPLVPNLAPNLAPKRVHDGRERQAVAKPEDQKAREPRPQTPENTEERRPRSSSDKGRQKAGDEIRTHDIHVGNVTLYH